MKKVSIIGSTGSIGINSLEVISRLPKDFSVVGLTAYRNIGLLEEQVKKFSPRFVSVKDDLSKELKARVNGRVEVLGEEGINRIASLKEADIVIISVSGSAALLPLLAAIRAGKTIALANKEALVMAGSIIMSEARKHRAKIIPVDSEQSAIFQCLLGREKKEIKKIYLTASGGPLASVAKKRFAKLSVRDVLKHPRWKMGKKITVDSATMMNKGLEVIEAMWLFDIRPKDIQVLIHRQAIVHSMVEFIDGSIIAQLAATDMRLPIQYAITFPERKKSQLSSLDFVKLGSLTFEPPDLIKFPALKLAYQAAKEGESLPCVLNAANEEAVSAFLNRRLPFTGICDTIRKVMNKHRIIKNFGLAEILKVDDWAREEARNIINK